MRYLGIFLVCLASIAFEIFLVRHFAITSWSEYGYWVISMAMAGYSMSGVLLCLFGPAFQRRQQALFCALPAAMALCCALGYAALGRIPFNPLELQNQVLVAGQMANIGLYYLALFPFFFLSGLYVGLTFLARQDSIPKVYTADLVGAGLGAATLLCCLAWMPPFLTPLLLLPPLLLAALTSLPGKGASRLGVAALVLCAGGVSAWIVAVHNGAAYSQYKPVSMALNVEDNRVLAELRSPRGHYLLLDSYLERHDTDLSNNYELLGAGGPPAALGLYRDGERLAALPRTGAWDTGYLSASLDSLPYLLRPGSRVLLAGCRGGFRLREAVELGASRVDSLESDPVLLSLLLAHGPSAPPRGSELRLPLQEGPPAVSEEDAAPPMAAQDADEYVPVPEDQEPLGSSAPAGRAAPPRLGSPLALENGASYAVIDVSPEFLDQGQANKYLLTTEGVSRLLTALTPTGVLSLPMGIGELPVYAIKAAATVRAGLMRTGVADPARHMLVVRSAFTARILASPMPFSPSDIAAARAFAAARSFDTPHYPGIDPATAEVFNDLPPVSFDTATSNAEQPGSDGFRPRDALMDDLAELMNGRVESSSFRFFDLSPSTQDRPFFHEILRLQNIGPVLARIDLLPRQEVGSLVNLAVLAQAALFAAVVFLLPLTRRRGMGSIGTGRLFSGFGYFLCLGLGFLFVEIVLIERFTFFLSDPAQAFALVLSAMLVASGLGSAFCGRFVARPRTGIRLACGATAALAAMLALLLPGLLNAALTWPAAAKAALTVGLAAPLGFCMGMPFPLGLSTYRGTASPFIPWAWSVNGALSVVATPLATLLAVSLGYTVVFAASVGLYALAALLAPDRTET
ncbi:hypothetical protein SAMN04488503_1864 [Humidesulfovibrio mexicanus]|uniref:Spermidine synthase n=1 Tax=Humidesulfovibrio mexicanus TaxID=147047 RepID=A0A239A7S0_9BACT|nr:hypothetical protein [Humidesulfovibrio mexicanus]SNR91128.1 hypothetical protein SAMN04488503_1864 [Humidesulfovibrio mexicanus]